METPASRSGSIRTPLSTTVPAKSSTEKPPTDDSVPSTKRRWIASNPPAAAPASDLKEDAVGPPNAYSTKLRPPDDTHRGNSTVTLPAVESKHRSITRSWVTFVTRDYVPWCFDPCSA